MKKILFLIIIFTSFVSLNVQSQSKPLNKQIVAPKTINQLNKTKIKIPVQRNIPSIGTSDRANSTQENNTVLGGPINTRPFERFSSSTRLWVDIENAMTEFKRSNDQHYAAQQALTRKTRQCFPVGHTLTVEQQRQVSCSRSDTAEECFKRHIDMCTRREKAAYDGALTLLNQDGKRVSEMLHRYHVFR